MLAFLVNKVPLKKHLMTLTTLKMIMIAKIKKRMQLRKKRHVVVEQQKNQKMIQLKMKIMKQLINLLSHLKRLLRKKMMR
ncbi:hypothetical protein BU586_01185 [Staphylococcus agnetis]|nr:hypothetical protein BU589_00175 [Staphylococcus agnetis]PTH71106.1 hypothetical protein BU586_01185 [Staphylococcus agnetis]PTH76929.1 hypothetical protein BU579_06600 [Staphylococcus agnetis]